MNSITYMNLNLKSNKEYIMSNSVEDIVTKAEKLFEEFKQVMWDNKELLESYFKDYDEDDQKAIDLAMDLESLCERAGFDGYEFS